MDGNDETRMDAVRPFDDDRLLSYVLGLEPDPELEAALAGDDELRARLNAVRADLGAVEQGLERIVPAPADDYADLSGERWAGLKPLLRQPGSRAKRRRSWLRVLAPVAAVALVLGVGVVALERSQPGQRTAATASDSAAEKGGAGNEAAPAVSGDGTLSGSAESGSPQGIREMAAGYRTVVVARAGSLGGEKQAFAVERVLKGEAADELLLDAGDRAVAEGALVVLYLRPAGTTSSAPGTPTPTGSDYASDFFDYSFRGRPALAQAVPAGIEPGEVTLP